MERADTKRSVIWLVLAMGTVLLLGIFFMTASSKQQVDTEQRERNNTAVRLVKSSLDLYYLKGYSTYPLEIEQLVEQQPTQEDKDTLNTAIEMLEDFEYKNRGDRKAYQISYTENGETKTVKGEYSNDYQ